MCYDWEEQEMMPVVNMLPEGMRLMQKEGKRKGEEESK